jgi:hypothetical protein
MSGGIESAVSAAWPLPLIAAEAELVGEALAVGPQPEAAESEDEKEDDEDGMGIESARTEAERVAPLRNLKQKHTKEIAKTQTKK